MKPRTEIINNKIVNWVELLASFLKSGDIFRKPRGITKYKVMDALLDQNAIVCQNMDTKSTEMIYINSPVFKLTMI